MIKGGVKGANQVFYTCPKCGMLNLFNVPKEFGYQVKNLKQFHGVPCANCRNVSRANEWMRNPLTDKDKKVKEELGI